MNLLAARVVEDQVSVWLTASLLWYPSVSVNGHDGRHQDGGVVRSELEETVVVAPPARAPGEVDVADLKEGRGHSVTEATGRRTSHTDEPSVAASGPLVSCPPTDRVVLPPSVGDQTADPFFSVGTVSQSGAGRELVPVLNSSGSYDQ